MRAEFNDIPSEYVANYTRDAGGDDYLAKMCVIHSVDLPPDPQAISFVEFYSLQYFPDPVLMFHNRDKPIPDQYEYVHSLKIEDGTEKQLPTLLPVMNGARGYFMHAVAVAQFSQSATSGISARTC